MKRLLSGVAAICLVGCVAPHTKTPVPATEAPSIIFPTNITPATARAAVPAFKSALAKVQPLTVIQTPPSAILITSSDVLLQWQPSPDVVAGYNLYYGVGSRQYTNQISVGANLSTVAAGLMAGATYYFAVTAYDDLGNESNFSDEAVYTVPEYIQMTFYFPSLVDTPSIQASSDFVEWNFVDTKPIVSTGQSFTVRAALDSSIMFFRAVAAAP